MEKWFAAFVAACLIGLGIPAHAEQFNISMYNPPSGPMNSSDYQQAHDPMTQNARIRALDNNTSVGGFHKGAIVVTPESGGNTINGNTLSPNVDLRGRPLRNRNGLVREIRMRIEECKQGHVLGNGRVLAELVWGYQDYDITASAFSLTNRRIRRWQVQDNYRLAKAELRDCKRGEYDGAGILLWVCKNKSSGVTPNLIGTTIYDIRWYVRANRRREKRLLDQLKRELKKSNGRR